MQHIDKLDRIRLSSDTSFPVFETETVIVYTPDKTIYTTPSEYLNMICLYLEHETSGLDFHLGYTSNGEISLTPIVIAG